MALKPRVRYGSTRLTFKKRVIEPLGPDDMFAVDTLEGSFVLSKADFHRVFPNVVRSSSYQNNGIYSYAVTPKRAQRFLRTPSAGDSLERGRLEIPTFLEGTCSERSYREWLEREALVQVRRDEQRGARSVGLDSYKQAIHEAVMASGATDAYTGAPLDWRQLDQFDADGAREDPRRARRRFANLPTADRVGRTLTGLAFRICSWRVAEAKGDLRFEELLDVCRQVLRHHERTQQKSKNSNPVLLAANADS